MYSQNYFRCSDGKNIFYSIWTPQSGVSPKAIVQVIHGMSDYSRRFANFASYLTDNGFIVFAGDLRGHGRTAENEDEYGFVSESNGWNRVVTDAYELADFICSSYPGLDIFVVGHAFGSCIARALAYVYPDYYSGVVAASSSASKGLVNTINKGLFKHKMKKSGAKASAAAVLKKTFENYNNKITLSFTDYDWVNSDVAEVQKYIQDPMCGFYCSNAFFYDMLCGNESVANKTNIRKISKDTAFLIISGSKDPYSNYGADVKKVYNLYERSRISDVQYKIYEGSRYDLFNEVNKQEVFSDILNWILVRLRTE